jgi:hypothetical protein
MGDEDVQVVEPGHLDVDHHFIRTGRGIVGFSQSQGLGAFDVVEKPGTHRRQGRRYIRPLCE